MLFYKLKYYFYVLLAITLIIYFLSDIIKYKTKNHMNFIIKYINENNIFEIPFIKIAYNEFQSSDMVKKYIDNFNYLKAKKEHNNLSKLEETVFETLSKDIEILKVSFLSSIVLDNEDYIEKELVKHIKELTSLIKKVQLLKFFKFILTISCIVMFIAIMF